MNETSRKDLGIALVRFIVGVVFLAHGTQKLFVMGFAGVGGFLTTLGVPMPGLFAVLVTLVEFLGGIALILGLFTRWAALLLAINMTVAVLAVHLKHGFFLQGGGYEYALTMLFVNVGLALTGAGAYALDNVLSKPRAAASNLRERTA